MSDDELRVTVHTRVDRSTIRRLRRRSARRPAKRSDRWWVVGAGGFSLLGWALTGPSVVWMVGLAAAAAFAIGEGLERRSLERDLAEIPPADRERTITVAESGVTVRAGDGRVLVDATWPQVDEIVREGGAYGIVVDGATLDVPLDAFDSELARGSFEALAARAGRPVHHD